MKIVLQDGIKDCGVCCLLSVIRFYGGDVSKEYLREITNTTKSGVSAYKLLEGALKIGFDGYGVKGDLINIEKNNLPCLSHLIVNKSYQHFVVIYDIDYEKEKVLLMDPAKGKRFLSFSEFRLLSSGNFIYLKPIKKLPVFSYDKVIYKNIKIFSKKNSFMVFYIIILSIFYFIINIVTAFHFKYLLEYVIQYSIQSNLFFISFFLLFLYLLKELILFVRNHLLIKWISMFDCFITLHIFKRIILLPYLYYKNRTTGEVISRIKDLSIIKDFLTKLLCFLTTDLLTILVFSCFMFNISTKLTLYSFLLVFVIVAYHFLTSSFKKKLVKINHKKEEGIHSYIIESLTSVDALKGLHIENNVITKFKSRYKHYLDSFYRLSFVHEIDLLFKNGMNHTLLVIVYGVGTYLVLIHQLNVAELFVYQGLLNYFLDSFNRICELQRDFHAYRVSLERVEDMFTIGYDKFVCGSYYHLYRLVGDIEYSNLSYSYNKTLLFHHLNLVIKKGDKVLLTGSSGIGKSSLVKMLMGYIHVDFGMIKINHIDISHYHLDVLRNRITYVTGNEFLFSNTIYNNICLNREVKREDVFDISKLVLVDEVVKKDSLGYQAVVEENGFNFSGGERQRIILARTLLKDSDIYIFDEALGQIDIERERTILSNIFKYLKDKTIIVVSHRFDNKDLFDRVLKLEKGEVHEI